MVMLSIKNPPFYDEDDDRGDAIVFSFYNSTRLAKNLFHAQIALFSHRKRLPLMWQPLSSANQPCSMLRTIVLTILPSARPLTFGISMPMTLPMSFGDEAPVFSTASLTRTRISSSESCAGRYGMSTSISALLELLDGVLAHLGFLADDADDVLIAELFVAAIDLGLTDGTAHETDDRQAVLIVALHGFFHISCKLFLDRHD